MMYFIFLLLLGFLFVIMGVASNPSPYFGSVALVVSSVLGAGVLAWADGVFLSLVLLLVYLGGMLVVFVYSVAMSADVYPEAWGGRFVFFYVVWLAAYLICLWWYVGCGWLLCVGVLGNNIFLVEDVGLDLLGFVLLYSSGGFCFLILGVGLLLTLFVVLDLVCGWYFGCVRISV